MHNLDISSDYLIFDNKETITFQNKGDSAVVINNVLRRPSVLAMEDGGGSVVYGAAIEFIIWKKEASSFILHDGIDFLMSDNGEELEYDDSVDIPRLNAKITDEYGKNYRVDVIDDSTWRTKWSLKATSDATEGVN